MNGDSRVEKMWSHFILEHCGMTGFAELERALVYHKPTYYIKTHIMEEVTIHLTVQFSSFERTKEHKEVFQLNHLFTN